MIPLSLVRIGARVVYVPLHCRGDRKHPDVERGVITAYISAPDVVRVRFDGDQIAKATPLALLHFED